MRNSQILCFEPEIHNDKKGQYIYLFYGKNQNVGDEIVVCPSKITNNEIKPHSRKGLGIISNIENCEPSHFTHLKPHRVSKVYFQPPEVK